MSDTKQQFNVRARCVVNKLIICEGCTKEQATKAPFDYAVDEIEIEQVDWEVWSVQEVK